MDAIGMTKLCKNVQLGASLLSRKRLLEAREYYSPARGDVPAETLFANCAERVAVHSDLVSARQLAGLDDDELNVLHAEFVRCPQRPPSDRTRHAIPLGVAMTLLGGFVLLLHAWLGASQALQLLAAACLGLGVAAIALGAFVGFSMIPLDLAHGTTGLLVGPLDEHHPWLQRAARLAIHPASEAYREEILRDRGCLRGMDCVMMREIAAAHDALEATRPSRSVAEQLQSQPTFAPGAAIEPRLVRLAAASAL